VTVSFLTLLHNTYIMNRSIKYFIAIILLSVTSYHAMATHLTGQDLTYAYLGDSAGLHHYRVTLTIYADCINGAPEAIADDNPAFLGVFDAASGITVAMDTLFNVSDTSMPITVYGPCDSGGTLLSVCMLRRVFIADFYLSPLANGYNIIYERCCLNGTIVNVLEPGNEGVTAICNIPPSTVVANNNCALFTNYPPQVIPDNFPLVFDCSATDADGDSLTYTLCQAINGNIESYTGLSLPPPAPPPFDSISYMFPLTYNNPMTCSVPLAIDPVSGLLTATPSSIGTYLIQVCCNEWRGGVLINKVQREFEFIVADCPLPVINDTLSRLVPQVLALSPNPAVSSVSIVLNAPIQQVTVMNYQGDKTDVPWNYETALGGRTDDCAISVDVSGLPPGLYFLKLNNNIIQKFIKQE